MKYYFFNRCLKLKISRFWVSLICVSLANLVPAITYAETSSKSEYVTRKEYDQLKKELVEIKASLKKEEKQSLDKNDKKIESVPTKELNDSQSKPDSILNRISNLESHAEESKFLDSHMLLAGSASAGYINAENQGSSFTSKFSPIFLWNINDRLLFEGEVELELSDSDTETKLEYAQILYSLNDNLTIGAGKFLSPLNVFVERYEPAWINKLPDTPLAVYDGILPESELGVQARGGVPVLEDMKVLYALYVSNGPSLNVDSDSAGSLNFDNFNDVNNNKAIGGRIGFLLFSNLEVGYGLEESKTNSADGELTGLNAFLQSADCDYSLESSDISGRFNIRGQYAWTEVGDAIYSLPDSGSALEFNNNRNGGYLQISYRPTKIEDLKNWELVSRIDHIKTPTNSPESLDENRYALGVDYWLDSRTLVKAAYDFDDQKNNPSSNILLFQLATGF